MVFLLAYPLRPDASRSFASRLLPYPSRTSAHLLRQRRSCTTGDPIRIELEVGQLLHPEPRDIEEDILPNKQAQVPTGVVVAFELLEHALRLFDTHAVLHRVVVIEREVPLWILIGRDAPLLRVLRHRCVLAQVERAKAQRMDMLLVRFQKLHRLPGFLFRLAWE